MFRLIIYPKGLGNLGLVRCSDDLLFPDHEDRRRRYLHRCETIKAEILEHIGLIESIDIEEDKY